jgi:hypothetical protein
MGLVKVASLVNSIEDRDALLQERRRVASALNLIDQAMRQASRL